ncbi:MAG TPA: tetratricopeptide repeat protein [Pyrinomonadaceae bacterium]|nr:tetratricopeptide repeat protein [Pyrinomonadaceae bacterium]
MKKTALHVALLIILLSLDSLSNTQAQSVREKPSSNISAGKKLKEALEKVQKQPTSSEAYINLGNAYARLRRVDEAIAAFKQAIRLRPDHEEAYFSLGNYYDWLTLTSKEGSKIQNQYATAALEIYKQIVRLNPDNAQAHFKLGESYEELKRNDEAIEAYKIAINSNAANDRAYFKLGRMYLDKVQSAKLSDAKSIRLVYSSELRNAINAFLQSVRIKPDAYTYSKLGQTYQLLGDYNNAIGAYKNSISHPSKDEVLKESIELEVYQRLLDIFIETNELARGEEILSQLVRENPNSSYGHYTLGRLYIHADNKSAALKEYKLLKRLKPSYLANFLFDSIYR